MIKAPYNFVPLAHKVVFPDWASRISIDHPFEAGISGTINVKYTSKTPVFIGNGKSENGNIDNYKAANGKYAIPGSSIRGMLRNVIEIASFGKFNRVSDAALSVRDLNNSSLYTQHFTKSKNGVHEVRSKAGWLKQDSETKRWFLYPVEYHRIEDSKLEERYGRNLDDRDPKRRIERISNKVKIFFVAEPIKDHKHHFDKNTGSYLMLKYSKVEKFDFRQFSGSKTGFTVLTGQCGRKHMDFIFEDKTDEALEVSNKIIKTFDDINVPNSANQKAGVALTKEFIFYQKKGYPGIPVFFLNDEKEELSSLGLAQMYKLPYKNSLYDAINNSSSDNYSDRLDFAECIFGKVKDTKKKDSENNISLRGRVQFEDATTDNGSLFKQVDTILGNPKPTYYPNYIQQNERNADYKTLMDSDVVLRGWKRYPVKDKTNPIHVGQEQKNVASHFIPLNTGTVFEGKIHFHNLKKEELGALLWAITWGGDKTLSHAVGMGKPYGFGQIKADISSLSYLRNDSENNDYKESSSEELNVWIDDFTKFMESAVGEWKQTSQLKELFAMANPANAERNGWDLSHMNLSNKEFVAAKKSKSFLALYSQDKQESRLSASSENGIANNSIQVCVLLNDKTKKGGWKAAVKDTPEICGPITNTADVPSDKNPGDEIKLKIVAVKGNQTSFRYEEKLS